MLSVDHRRDGMNVRSERGSGGRRASHKREVKEGQHGEQTDQSYPAWQDRPSSEQFRHVVPFIARSIDREMQPDGDMLTNPSRSACGSKRTDRDVGYLVAFGGKADIRRRLPNERDL
jgi:hypothetical protein